MRRSAPSWLVLGASLAACSPDYGAVRDWSVEARSAVLPHPAERPPAAQPAAPLPPLAVTEAGRDGARRALEEAAAAWLALLAFLADDGLPLDRENALAVLAEPVAPFDAEGAAALRELGEVMASAARRNWRAPYLGTAVERGDPAFQGVLAALLRLAEAEAASPAAPEPAADARLPEEVRALLAADRARRDMARAARIAALRRIAEGHAVLRERGSRLSSAETAQLLRAQEAELRRLGAGVLAWR